MLLFFSWAKFDKYVLSTIYVTNNMILVFLDSHASGFKKMYRF